MRKEELVRKLKALQDFSKEHDEEEAHKKADNLLLEFIHDFDITDAFTKIKRYYT